MLNNLLLRLAIESGRIGFEEKPTHFRMYAAVLGAKISLAILTKQELASILAQTATGEVAPAQPVSAGSEPELPPVSHPAPRKKPFKLELVK